jgi:DNA polymerase III epsilon subunit-like protein
MDAALWFRDWVIRYDGFPDSYIVIDTETTGKDVTKDVMIQLGWCKVIDHKLVENSGVIFNWTRSPLTDPMWVKKRMERTAAEMAKKDKVYPWTFDMLADGQNPIHILTDLIQMICEARINEWPIVAHNGIGLDYPLIVNHFKRFLKVDFSFLPEEMWDTAALEKGSILDEFMYGNELPGDFAWRVLERPTDCGIKFSLHDHCIPKYDLATKYNLDLFKQHTAPFDAYVTHLVFEEFRALSEDGLKRYPRDYD